MIDMEINCLCLIAQIQMKIKDEGNSNLLKAKENIFDAFLVYDWLYPNCKNSQVFKQI